jgi:endonuclease/exonuclease/phosphatase family metal-dependent hydrolase
MHMSNPLRSFAARLFLESILMLAFFSTLTSFVEATYVFGLLGSDIPPEIVYVLFLLSPFILIVFPRLMNRTFTLLSGGLAILCWAVSLPLNTRWRMLVAGVGCGLFLLFFASRLYKSGRGMVELGGGLGFGVLLSILLRSLHSGNMLLSTGYSLVIGVVLAGIALVLLMANWREKAGGPAVPAVSTGPARKGGFLRSQCLSLGLTSALILLYFGFTSPAVIARWGEVSYPLVTAVEVGAVAVFLGLWVLAPGFRARLTTPLLFGWNLLFVMALGGTLLSRQLHFPAATIYPLYADASGPFSTALFWAMLVLHPVIYADFCFLAGALQAGKASPRRFAAGFAVGAFFLLLGIFAQIFTTVYDYIPVIGPWFRDRFWIVVCVPGLVLTLSALLRGRRVSEEPRAPRMSPAWLGMPAVIAAVAVLFAVIGGARPAAGQPESGLRILTYNIQQGYGKDGEKSYDRQLEVIRRLAPDVLGLQETDTARIAGGNSDVVRYLADSLNMYSYYGPAPESGTFGIALLSRYPIESPRTFFMPSRGEQTAAIEAGITVGGRLFRVYVTHLDNDGALAQQRVILDRAADGSSGPGTTIIMGDFNFKTSTEQYRVTTALLDDAWTNAFMQTVEGGAPDPAGRIDHIFLTRGTRVAHGTYIPKGPSDHPAMFAEIGF